MSLGIRLSLMWLALLIGTGLHAHTRQNPVANDAPTGNTELDLNSYRATLSRIAEAVKRGQNLHAVQRDLPDKWIIRSKTDVYEVSTKPIADALGEIERDPAKNKIVARQLESRLALMQSAAAALEARPDGPPTKDAKEKLTKILNGSEFQEGKSGPSAWDLWRARMNRWIFEHLIAFLERLHISQATSNFLAWGLIFIAVVALFYGVYRWMSKNAGNVEFTAETEAIASEVRRWLQEALKAADRGDFREAIHCAYWAAISRMEDTGRLTRDRARTPRESLRLLEHHPKEQGFLRTVTRSFELIWYGYRPASATDWAAAKEQLEKMGCLQVSTAPTAPS